MAVIANERSEKSNFQPKSNLPGGRSPREPACADSLAMTFNFKDIAVIASNKSEANSDPE